VVVVGPEVVVVVVVVIKVNGSTAIAENSSVGEAVIVRATPRVILKSCIYPLKKFDIDDPPEYEAPIRGDAARYTVESE
jgi:hypothetical protein